MQIVVPNTTHRRWASQELYRKRVDDDVRYAGQRWKEGRWKDWLTMFSWLSGSHLSTPGPLYGSCRCIFMKEKDTLLKINLISVEEEKEWWVIKKTIYRVSVGCRVFSPSSLLQFVALLDWRTLTEAGLCEKNWPSAIITGGRGRTR